MTSRNSADENFNLTASTCQEDWLYYHVGVKVIQQGRTLKQLKNTVLSLKPSSNAVTKTKHNILGEYNQTETKQNNYFVGFEYYTSIAAA